MSVNYGQSVPGIRSDRTYTPREVLWTKDGSFYLPAGRVIDGSKSRDPLNGNDLVTLRPGCMMGKITASGKYRPTIIGLSNLVYTSGDLLIQTDLATATEVARLKTLGGGGNLSLNFIGPPGAAGVVAKTAVTCTGVVLNGATSQITTANLGLNKVTGSLITLADGSETPLGVLDEFLRVTDVDGNSLDCQMAKLLVAGFIDEAQLLNWPADASTRTYLLDLLNTPKAGCGPFRAKGNF